MLRAARFKNFINFKEEQLLQFNKSGVYLFVGENNSGKSSVFEAVRRCLDMKSNFSFSMNVPNEAEPTYAICDFSLPEDTRNKFQDHNRILTSFVHINGSESAKVVIITDERETENEVLHFDIILRGDFRRPSQNFPCQIDEQDKNTLIMNLKELVENKEKNSGEFLNTVSKIIERYIQITTESKFKRTVKTFLETIFPFGSRVIGIFRWLGSYSFLHKESFTITECEKILEALSEHVVCTFGLRAVGGVQWTKSSNVRKGEENYYSASVRCEIIKWFHDRQTDDTFDTSKAEEIFTTLTGGESFKFHFENNEGKELLVVENGRGKKFSILKCPEGILEAKHISLLLAYKLFRTLLLEEPDRGMHPQMIHRMRSIILAAEQEKTIIIISHNASLISTELIPRTFKFCKIGNQAIRDNNGNVRFEIVNIGNVIKQVPEPIPRIASEQYASVFYARRILFVEGESDFIFIRGLFSHILNPETEASTRSIFNLLLELHNDLAKVPNALKMLKHLLTSLYVMKLDGHGDKEKWHSFCEAIYTPHIFILDADAVIETKTSDRRGGTAVKHTKDINTKGRTASERAKVINNTITGMIMKEIEERITVLNESADISSAVGNHSIIDGLREKEIRLKVACNITDFLMKTFLNEAPSISECKNFSEESKNIIIKQIVNIATQENIIHENVDLERHFGRIDARFYGKIYTEKIDGWVIPKSRDLPSMKESKMSKTRIVSEEGIRKFQRCLDGNQWTDARNVLEEYDIFVWKDGSLEDVILGIILATNAEDEETRTDEIFRKYLAFYSLKLDLPLESFRDKHSTKLYLEKSKKKLDSGDHRKDICEEDIHNSIDRVFKFCKKDSEIIHFLHFLTQYALKQYIYETEV